MRHVEALAVGLLGLCILSFGGLWSLRAHRAPCAVAAAAEEVGPSTAPVGTDEAPNEGASDAAAIAWLAERVEARLRAHTVRVAERHKMRRRILRHVRNATDREWAHTSKRTFTACGVQCRLSQCAQLPVGRSSPGELSVVSQARANFTVWAPPEKKKKKQQRRHLGRPDEFVHRVEQKFWRRVVDEAGVERFQAAFSRAFRMYGAEVPCTAEPYADYIVGLREHLPPRGAARPPAVDPDAERLDARLAYQQHDRALCTHTGARMAESIGRVGIGGVLKILTLPFTWAFEQGRPFVVADATLQPSQKSLWDLLEPFSSCTEAEARGPDWTHYFTPNLRSGKYTVQEFRDRGHFWWIAHLTRYMFKPRPAVAEAIAAARTTMPAGVPYIGMHIRHGDKCEGERPDGPGTAAGYDFRVLDDRQRDFDSRAECGSLTEFMVHAERLRDLYGIRHIWLATDDADVVDRALTDPCYAHWDFHFQKMHRLVPADYAYEEADGTRGFGFEECQNVKQAKVKVRCIAERDRYTDSLTMLVDLAMLADADAMVLAFSSNIGRIAYELASANKNCLPPVISRDIGWCFTDGQVLDGSPWGHLNC